MAKRSPKTDDPSSGDARADALKFLTKHVSSAFRDPDADLVPLVGVSTGSVAVDYIIGNGGFPRSKISELFGAPSSGKSTLAAMACAKAQADGLYPVYVDVERGLDRAFAEKMGFDVGAALAGTRGLYVRPETFEDMLTIVDKMVTDGKADLVIVDSVEALVTQSQMKGDIGDTGALGTKARMFANCLPRLNQIIDRPDHKTALVFVNQLRANIQTGWQPPGAAANAQPTKAGGGWALHHFSSLRLELKQTKKNAKVIERPSIIGASKPDEIPVASLHSAMTFKNKVSLPYRKIEFYIRYDEEMDRWGIDNLQTLLDVATTQGIVQPKGGGYFLYDGAENMRVQGEDAFYQWFAQRPAALDELRSKLTL